MNRRRLLKTGANTAMLAGIGTVASAPALAQKRIEISMVSTWPRDFPGVGTGAQRLAKRITEMSGGRLNVTYFAAGEKVKPFDAFDEVASGNSQMYHAPEYYWKGKHPGWSYFTAIPFGLSSTETSAWVRFGGGQALWDELGAEFGLKSLMAGATGCQMAGWFRKRIDGPDDLKGLKMRIPGLAGDVMTKVGVSTVSLPASQIYENLVSGTIDAAEWIGPWNDLAMKLYEAAKYYYYPGIHEPGAIGALGINRTFWEKLSRSDRILIEAAATMEFDFMLAEYNARNGDALTTLITEHGVELHPFDESIVDALWEGTEQVIGEVREHDALARRINDSYVGARDGLGRWMNISDVAYMRQRNRVLNL